MKTRYKVTDTYKQLRKEGPPEKMTAVIGMTGNRFWAQPEARGRITNQLIKKWEYTQKHPTASQKYTTKMDKIPYGLLLFSLLRENLDQQKQPHVQHIVLNTIIEHMNINKKRSLDEQDQIEKLESMPMPMQLTSQQTPEMQIEKENTKMGYTKTKFKNNLQNFPFLIHFLELLAIS